MSNSFIAAWGFLPPDITVPDWEAAKATVSTLQLDELTSYWEQANGQEAEEEDAGEARNDILAALDVLKDSWEEGTDGVNITTPDGWTVVLRGGSSWGDDPNDGFTVVSNLQEAPTVWAALGFHVQRPSVPGEFSIVELVRVMSEVLDLTNHIREATAGGTVALWTDLADGSVVCVTDMHDPFTPDADDVVKPEGFMVGKYASQDVYLNGDAPAAVQVPATMTDLRKALQLANGPTTEHLCDAECGDPEHPRDGRITLVVQ